MGFWSKFAKIAIPVGAGLATVFTGGAAAPLLGMALGAGSGAATSALSGGGWKGALKGAAIGGALGGVGGGALKGMGGLGSFAKQAVRYAPSAIQATKGLTGGSQAAPQYSQQMAPAPMAQGMGYLSPIGLNNPRRTTMEGMGTRVYG